MNQENEKDSLERMNFVLDLNDPQKVIAFFGGVFDVASSAIKALEVIADLLEKGKAGQAQEIASLAVTAHQQAIEAVLAEMATPISGEVKH